jgi:gamma-carbonic anhydrase
MTNFSLIPFNGKSPVIHPTAFIAAGARLIGDVEIGEGSSIWFNCVLRADVNAIRVGKRSNIQDGTVIHCDGPHGDAPGNPTIIGDDVLIGHMAMIHGCTLENRAFAGLGSIVMDGCVIESDGMLAAGAMLTPGKRLPSGQLWAGRPAKFVRPLDERAIKGMHLGVGGYAMLAQRYREDANAA